MTSLLDIVLERMTSSVIPGTPLGDQLLAVLQSLAPPDATQYFGAANDVLLAPSARTTASPASPMRRLLIGTCVSSRSRATKTFGRRTGAL